MMWVELLEVALLAGGSSPSFHSMVMEIQDSPCSLTDLSLRFLRNHVVETTKADAPSCQFVSLLKSSDPEPEQDRHGRNSCFELNLTQEEVLPANHILLQL